MPYQFRPPEDVLTHLWGREEGRKVELESNIQLHRQYVIEPQQKLWTLKAWVRFLGW